MREPNFNQSDDFFEKILNEIINVIKKRSIENATEYEFFGQFSLAGDSIELAARCSWDPLFWRKAGELYAKAENYGYASFAYNKAAGLTDDIEDWRHAAVNYRYCLRHQEAAYCYNMAANQSDDFNDWRHAMYHYYSIHKEHQEGTFCFFRAKEQCKTLDDYTKLADTLSRLKLHLNAARIYEEITKNIENDEKHPQELKTGFYIKAGSIFEDAGNFYSAALNFNNAARISEDITHWESVIRNYEKLLAVDSTNTTQIKKALAYAVNQIINIQGKHNVSIQLLSKAKAYYEDIDDERNKNYYHSLINERYAINAASSGEHINASNYYALAAESALSVDNLNSAEKLYENAAKELIMFAKKQLNPANPDDIKMKRILTANILNTKQRTALAIFWLQVAELRIKTQDTAFNIAFAYNKAAEISEDGHHYLRSAIYYEKTGQNTKEASHMYGYGAFHLNNLAKQTNDLDDWCNAGLCYLKVGKEKDANFCFMKALSHHTPPEIYLTIADALQSNGYNTNVKTWLIDAAKGFKNQKKYDQAFEIFIRVGWYQDAYHLVDDQLLSITEHHAQIFFNTGHYGFAGKIYEKIGSIPNAIDSYKKAKWHKDISRLQSKSQYRGSFWNRPIETNEDHKKRFKYELSQ